MARSSSWATLITVPVIALFVGLFFGARYTHNRCEEAHGIPDLLLAADTANAAVVEDAATGIVTSAMADTIPTNSTGGWWFVIDPVEGVYFWDENSDLVPDPLPWDIDRDGQLDRDYVTPRFETEAERDEYERIFGWWDDAIPGLRSALPAPIPADAVQ